MTTTVIYQDNEDSQVLDAKHDNTTFQVHESGNLYIMDVVTRKPLAIYAYGTWRRVYEG